MNLKCIICKYHSFQFSSFFSQDEIEKVLIEALLQRKCEVVERNDCEASESLGGSDQEEEVCEVVQREECGDPFKQCEQKCAPSIYSCEVCPPTPGRR